MSTYRVLIVEDVQQARQWMEQIATKALAGTRLTVTMADTVDAGLAAIQDALTQDAPFDFALVDLNLPDGDGCRVVRALAETMGRTISIVTTIMASDAAITGALAAGAQGYLLKSQPEAQLVRQLQLIQSGVPAISPPVARRIMKHFASARPTEQQDWGLTPRETEVLALIAQGLRVGEVANRANIAESTVASHVKAVYRKLGISTRAEATLHASRMGLVD